MLPRLSRFFAIICLLHATPCFAIDTVTVMADNSLSLAMTALARDYAKSSNAIVNTSFAASAAQQSQISEGSAADILITPKAEWIENLKTQGVVDIYSQTPIARNRIALVAPTNSPLQIKLANGFPVSLLIQQFGWEPNFVVASPDILEEGAFSKEALRNLGVANDLEEYTLYIKRLDQMFDMVANHGMYGLFFYSSTIGKTGVRVLDLLPEDSHRPIEYNAVVLAGDNMDEARKFITYLKSDNAKEILRDYGFLAN